MKRVEKDLKRALQRALRGSSKVETPGVEHFCVSLSQEPVGSAPTACCPGLRSALHSSVLVNGWQSFSFSRSEEIFRYL